MTTTTNSPGRWTAELDQLLRDWAAEGVTLDEQIARLEAVLPGAGITMGSLSARRHRLGVTVPPNWRGRPLELLHRMYGVWSPAAIANAIERDTGWRPSIKHVSQKASREGLSARDPRGWVCLSDAARALNADMVTVSRALEVIGIKPRGRGQASLLDERMMATLAAIFPDLPVDWLTDEEAAADLGLGRGEIRRLCMGGELAGRRWGVGRQWRIPPRELARWKAPKWVEADPADAFNACLLGAWVTAKSPLYVVGRSDGSMLVPSPTSERTTYRRGAVMGRVVSLRAGQAVVDGRVAQLPCDVELLGIEEEI